MPREYIIIENPPEQEKAVTIAVKLPGTRPETVSEEIQELNSLAGTANLSVAHSFVVQARNVNPGCFIGSGKAQEIAALCQYEKIQAVLFNDDLSPAQVRNLQDIFSCKVLDRTELILAIFAMRAQTREARLQVELAQLQYMMPRLVGCWKHLSRQQGGIGTRGPGEKQLEIDRRRIKTRIMRLEHELEAVKKERDSQRKLRQRCGLFTAAIVGYTNSGKTTLLNALTGSQNLAEDKLFATLDTKSKTLELQSGLKVLFVDTVGFIRKLPHHLVEAFSSTLEEARTADMLLHVIDVSHPACVEQALTSAGVLKEIGASDVPVLNVYNKIDGLAENAARAQSVAALLGRDGIAVSAKTSENLSALLSAVESWEKRGYETLCIESAAANHRIIAFLHEHGVVRQMSYKGDRAVYDVLLKKDLVPQAKKIASFE